MYGFFVDRCCGEAEPVDLRHPPAASRPLVSAHDPAGFRYPTPSTPACAATSFACGANVIACASDKLRGNDVAAAEAALAQKIAASTAARAARAASVPAIAYPGRAADLGTTATRSARAIEQHPVVIVCGETGSGKTTQLPKICLEAGRGVAGIIGHTQPRRIAARAVGARIAEELEDAARSARRLQAALPGSQPPGRPIKLMTDGILLAETQGDRFLDAYDTIIVDEAHERSLNIDFLLGYLKWLLPQAARPEARHHVGDHRSGALLEALRRRADHQCVGPQLSGRGPLPRRRARRGDDETAADEQAAILSAVDELWSRAGRRHPGVPERRARDPRDRRIAAQTSSAGLRGAAAVLAAVAGRAAARVQALGTPPRRARDQRRRNLADRAGHPRGDRHGRRAHQPLQPSQPPAAAAHREDLAGLGESALGPLRPRRARRRHPPVFRRGLSRAAGIHRARDPAHEPGRGHPADARAEARRHRGFSVRRAARWPLRARWPAHAARARRASTKKAQLTDIGRRLAKLPLDPRLGRILLARRARNTASRKSRSSPRRCRCRIRATVRPTSRPRPTRNTRRCATSSRISCRCSSCGANATKQREHLSRAQAARLVQGELPLLPAAHRMARRARPGHGSGQGRARAAS